MCLIGSVLEGTPKIEKWTLAMGATNGGAAAKIVKNVHLLVIMRVRILQKVCLTT